MTKEQILAQCTWDDYDMATLNVEIPIWKQKTEVTLIPEYNAGRVITDDMAQAVNDVLNLTEQQANKIKDYIFWFYNLCCETTYYGFDAKAGETDTEANKRHFGVKNREDAFAKSILKSINIEESTDRVATFHFYAEWEDEHGCEIAIRNGEVENFG